MAATEYNQPELLVETGWLAENLDDPQIRIVDCDPFESYQRAHIPNAIGIPVHHYIKEPEYISDSRKHPLVAPPDTIKALMEGMGIGDENLVITYDSNGCLWSSRFWWVLNHYGFTNVKVLNGGWNKWVEEGHTVSIQPSSTPPASFTPRVNPKLLCTLKYGQANIGNSDVVFLDVRSDGEWSGTNDRGNRRAGRIPGAVHLEWLNFVTDDTYKTIKPAADLRAMLAAVGATPDKEIITY